MTLPQVVSFRCVLKSSTGRWISTSVNQDVITEAPGNPGSELPALAQKLKDLRKGEHRQVKLAAPEAYGFYDPSLVLRIPRSEIQQRVKPGESVVVLDAAGKPRSYRVSSIQRDELVLDGNHPLAGEDLIFEIEVLDAREATPEDFEDSSLQEDGRRLH